MIKGILELFIIISVTSIINFNKKVVLANEQLDLFYKGIEGSSMSYIFDNEVHMTFDYLYINDIASSTFKEFEVKVEEINDCYFVITVFVSESFLKKEIREEIFLRKGDMYD